MLPLFIACSATAPAPSTPSGAPFAEVIAPAPGGPLRATQVAVGGEHACVIGSSGAVWCWGADTFGQLGRGSETRGQLFGPAPVPWLTDAIDLSAGDEHTCAVRAGGEVVCWGSNLYGQLGHGGTERYASPHPVPGAAGATAIDLGADSSCALLAGGAAVCWGYNNHGQLRSGAGRERSPVDVGLEGVRTIAQGGFAACAVGAETTCWGLGLGGPPVQVEAISVGWMACGVAAGQVSCWGDSPSEAPIASPVAGLPPIVEVDAGGPIVARSQSGEVWTIEAGGVSRVKGLAADDVSAARGVACAVDRKQRVWCWGDNAHGVVQRAPVGPVPVPGPEGVVAVSAGQGRSCAIDGAGEVWCWGRGEAAAAVGVSDAVEIDLEGQVACARTRRGEVWCWGAAAYALGEGHRGRAAPTRVEGIEGATAILSSARSACARVGDETRCWGKGGSPGRDIGPELRAGAATGTYCSVTAERRLRCYQEVTSHDQWSGVVLEGVDDVAVAIDRTCALRSGAVQCAEELRAAWTSVDVPGGVSVLAAGEGMHCAASDQGVWCWRGRAAPARIGEAVRDLDVGDHHACVADTTGAVWCWGRDDRGQVSGEGSHIASPQQIYRSQR